MLMRWNTPSFAGFGPSFWAVDDLHREMGRLFQSFDDAWPTGGPLSRAFAAAEPQLKLQDAAEELRVYAELPGFRAEDVQVSFDDGTLTVRAERASATPEGYVARRRERGDLSFTRTLTLPVRIDADKISAQLKNGVLELRLPKQAEARPRTIAVKSA